MPSYSFYKFFLCLASAVAGAMLVTSLTLQSYWGTWGQFSGLKLMFILGLFASWVAIGLAVGGPFPD